MGFPAAADYLQDNDFAYGEDAVTITDGIVSAVRKLTLSASGQPVELLQISAPINGGNSGGPLLNESGLVVGVNALSVNDSQGVYGAISVSELTELLNTVEIDDGAEIGEFVPVGEYSASYPFAAIAVACLLLFSVFLILSLRKKQTMQKFLDKHNGALLPSQAYWLMRPVLRRLSEMHGIGDAYLRLDPRNIYIGVKSKKSLSRKENRKNTSEEFAAPEYAKGEIFGSRSDVYVLCAIYCRLLLGEPLKILADGSVDFSDVPTSIAPILQRGLSPDPEARPAMPELEQTLTAFSGSEPVKLHKSKAKIAAASTVLVVALVGLSFGASSAINRKHELNLSNQNEFYIEACKSALNNQQFVVAEEYYAKVYRDIDTLTVERAYMDAWTLLQQQEYDAAYDAFSALSGSYDAEKMMIETRIQEGLAYLDKEIFYRAREIFLELVENGYPEAEELVNETDYLFACNYGNWSETDRALLLSPTFAIYDDKIYGDKISAFNLFSEIGNYKDAPEKVERLKAEIYSEAQSKYRNGAIFDSKNGFNAINPYLESGKYLQLIGRYYQLPGSYDYKTLLSLIGFENAAELLLANQTIATTFLKGKWSDAQGHYFQIRDDNRASYNIRGYENLTGQYYHIESGDYYSGTTKVWHFEVIDKDTIYVTAYRGDYAYWLTRE